MAAAIRKRPRGPQSIDEWQEVANVAQAVLVLESARLYGLVTDGPKANVERCEKLLRRARAQGVEPKEEEVDGILRALAQW